MPTDDERREVARRLRDVQGDVIPGTKTEVHPIAGRIIGVACGYDLPDFQGLLGRLADLIEPSPSCEFWDSEWQECYSVRTVRTCRAVGYRMDLGEDVIAATCSECGELLVNFDFEQDPPKPTGYCPHCGAKVVDE